MRGGKRDAPETAVFGAEQRDPLRTDGVHHRLEVVRQIFELKETLLIGPGRSVPTLLGDGFETS